MGKILKKFDRGAATNYVTRKAALKKLQLSLKDFRRLCILKGIHPHEPKHKKKVNKGSTAIKTWYYAKDIKFLQHEPIIQKFRDYKVFLRRLKRAKDKREKGRLSKLYQNKPKYRLDHIVKERYPTFVDAVRDLDDGLCLLFLFARLPKSLKVPSERVQLCRRLTVEFLHYVIEASALRKVFVSIKGIYYQAEIFGQSVNWVVAHERGLPNVNDVDFEVMSTFIEFYSTALGFVNFRLFREIGLQYPPRIDAVILEETGSASDILYSLNENLKKDADFLANQVDQPMPDNFPENNSENDNDDESKLKEYERKRLKILFEKCKFFLSRETPRESLTFVIRCCGGTVSWDPLVASGSKYPESDESITHQIVDRPNVENQFLSRRYVQPQWVYDCINARELLPVGPYSPGAILPPHLSPFTKESPSDYVPPEKIQLLEQQGLDISGFVTAETNVSHASANGPNLDDQFEIKEEIDEKTEESKVEKPKKRKTGTKTESINLQEPEMKVVSGETKREKQPRAKIADESREHRKMREMMIPKKQRRVYQKILKKRKHATTEAQNLKEKRETIEREKRRKNLAS